VATPTTKEPTKSARATAVVSEGAPRQRRNQNRRSQYEGGVHRAALERAKVDEFEHQQQDESDLRHPAAAGLGARITPEYEKGQQIDLGKYCLGHGVLVAHERRVLDPELGIDGTEIRDWPVLLDETHHGGDGHGGDQPPNHIQPHRVLVAGPLDQRHKDGEQHRILDQLVERVPANGSPHRAEGEQPDKPSHQSWKGVAPEPFQNRRKRVALEAGVEQHHKPAHQLDSQEFGLSIHHEDDLAIAHATAHREDR